MKLSLDSIGYGGYFTAPGEQADLEEAIKRIADDVQSAMGIADAGLYIDVRKDYSSGSSFFGLINAVRIYNRAKIGASSDGTDRFFEGSIDNVRVYERALSGTEISDMSKGVHGDAYEGSSRVEHGKIHGKLRALANNTSLSVDREKEKAVSLLDTFH